MSGAGKGDSPRNCFSKNYRNNYDSIQWTGKKNINNQKKENRQWIGLEKNMTKKISSEEGSKKENT